MSDLHLRSTRLYAMPPIGEAPLKRLLVLVIRWGLFLGLLGILLFVFILPIGQRWFPISPNQPLYLFHDYIYLTLKGQLFTRFYPFSLILVGCMIPLGLLLVAGLLYVKVIRFLQISIYRLLLRSGNHRRLREAAHTFYTRLNLLPQVMLLVVAHSLESNLLRLSQSNFQQATEGLCNRIVSALELYIHLYATYYRKEHTDMDEMMLDTFERWHRTLLLLSAYANQTAYTANVERMRALFSMIGEPADKPNGMDVFSLVAIWHDLDILQRLSSRRMYDSRNLIELISSEASALELMQAVSDHANARRLQLQAITLELQRSLQNIRTAFLSREFLALPQDSPMLNHLVSRLALGIATHLALLLDNPTPARAYLEALETLAVVLSAVDDADTATYQALIDVDLASVDLPGWNPAHILFGHLPMAESRCIIGWLSRRYYLTQKSQLDWPSADQTSRKLPLLVKTDINFASKTASQWFYAADLRKGQDDAE